ncbi:FecR family protein [Chitinophaga defluvii]|uniref:FecR family protein n=1 Tax=Chitinophaga defluvii TaxID=3163343 RepID=A0ABV2TBP9_9BACT
MDFRDYGTAELVCDETFQRYCLGDHPADVLFWENWLLQHPEKAAIAEEARQLFFILNANQGNRLKQLQQLREGMHGAAFLRQHLPSASTPAAAHSRSLSVSDSLVNADSGPQAPAIPPRRLVAPVLKYAAGIAAAVLVAVTAYLGVYRFRQPAAQNSAAVTGNTIYQAGNHARKTLVLADGSVITLRENSALTVPPNFNTTTREVTLSGEAFFDVKHQQQQPFIVHTPAIDITVLGTVFNVSAYKNNPQTETALFRGKVEVALKDQPTQKITLYPNQKIVISNISPDQQPALPFKVIPLAQDPVNHKAKEIAWVRNRLEIENESLEQIAVKLEKWYGIPVTFTGEEVRKYRYSGTFESETIVKALEALQLSYPFNFRVDQDVIIISK